MERFLLILICAVSGFSAQAQLTLDECQTRAHDNYPLIKQYGLIEQSTEYSITNAAKAYLPQVTLSAQATYQSDVAAFPEKMTSLYQQIGIDMKGLNKDQYKMALEVNQTIWDGGLTRAQKDVSTAEGQVSAQTIETELYNLRERINGLYFGILILNEQIRLNTLLQELLQSNYAIAEACVKNGVAMQSDLNSIKAEQLTVAQQRTQIESASDAYRRMLSVMTGQPMPESATFDKPAPTVALPSPSNNSNNRPELQYYSAQTAYLEAQKRAVLASTMPKIGVFAQGFYGNPGLNLFKDMTEDRWTWNYIAGLRLQWNFGSFYTKKGNIQKLTLAQQQTDNRRETFLYNNNLQQIQQQNAIEKMQKVMTDDDEIIRLRHSIRIASEAKYANGAITVNDLLHDVTTENQAALNKSLHELEWLKTIYELKYTRNN